MTQAEAVRSTIITECGIPADRLEVEIKEGQDYALLAVKGEQMLSDRQIRCYSDKLAESLLSLWPSLESERPGERYDVLRREMALTNARADLERRGLLRKVPRFDPANEDLAQFALRLEELCHAAPQSALVVEDDWITWASRSVETETFAQVDSFICATSAATYAGFEPSSPPLQIPVVPRPR